MPFPGHESFPASARPGHPCRSRPPSRAAARNPVSVWVGRASYSIYLVHWPLLVFYSVYTFSEPSTGARFALLAASLVLGWLQYRLVEQRFRFGGRPGAWSPPAFGLGCAMLVLLLVLPASTIWATGGAAWRIPEDRVALTNAEWRDVERKAYCDNFGDAVPRALFTCQNFRNADRDLFIWGDSHAQHLVAGASQAFPDRNIYVAYMTGCVPQSGFLGYVRGEPTADLTKDCIERNKQMLEFLGHHRKSAVIVTNAKRSTPEAVAPAINYIMAEAAAAGTGSSTWPTSSARRGCWPNAAWCPDYVIRPLSCQRRCTGDPAAARPTSYNRKLSKLVAPVRRHCRHPVPRRVQVLRWIDASLSRRPSPDDEGAIRFVGMLKAEGRLAELCKP
jgi:hypothetical protein